MRMAIVFVPATALCPGCGDAMATGTSAVVDTDDVSPRRSYYHLECLEHRAAELSRTPGTSEYREAVEASGQLSLNGKGSV